MNDNGYYQNPIFPGLERINNTIPSFENKDFLTPSEETIDLDKILDLNKKKKAKFYIVIPYSKEDITIDGILEDTGIDYIIISSPSNGYWSIVPRKYLAYISFDEKINLK